jgi:predicted transcriptional regulator
MTEKIQLIIDEISRKSKALHHQLVEERLQNEQLKLENVNLREQLLSSKSRIESQASEIKKLSEEMESIKTQVVEVPVASLTVRDEEIDELVKEIEYCISQLKK